MGLFSKKKIELEEGCLVLESKYFSYEIPYSDIHLVKLRDDVEVGRMTKGTKGALVHYGRFENGDYGTYDMIYNVTAKLLIVLGFGDGRYVLFNKGGMDKTKEFYMALKRKTGLL